MKSRTTLHAKSAAIWEFRNRDSYFECDILAVYYNGVMAGGEDFDNASGTFLSVIKESFPDDIAIQEL